MSKIPSRTIELLRTAVSSGAHAEAERLLGIYRVEMQAQWAAASSAEQRATIAAEVRRATGVGTYFHPRGSRAFATPPDSSDLQESLHVTFAMKAKEPSEI